MAASLTSGAAIAVQEERMIILPGLPHTRSDRGASSVEYAILVALIALIILAAVSFFGQRTSGLFEKTCASVAHTQGSTC